MNKQDLITIICSIHKNIETLTQEIKQLRQEVGVIREECTNNSSDISFFSEQTLAAEDVKPELKHLSSLASRDLIIQDLDTRSLNKAVDFAAEISTKDSKPLVTPISISKKTATPPVSLPAVPETRKEPPQDPERTRLLQLASQFSYASPPVSVLQIWENHTVDNYVAKGVPCAQTLDKLLGSSWKTGVTRKRYFRYKRVCKIINDMKKSGLYGKTEEKCCIELQRIIYANKVSLSKLMDGQIDKDLIPV